MFLDGLSLLIESFACSAIFLPLMFQYLICFPKSLMSTILKPVSLRVFFEQRRVFIWPKKAFIYPALALI